MTNVTHKFSTITSIIVILITLISACSGNPVATMVNENPTATDTPEMISTGEVVETMTPQDIPAAGTPTDTAPEEIQEKSPVSYTITAQLDYSAKQIEIDQQIQIMGLLAGVEEMALICEPNRYPGGFELHSLVIDQTVIENYALNSNQLRFDLTEAARSTGSAIIQLTYTIKLPAIPPPSEMYKPQPYGYTDRQVNLVDWYPFVPPLDENGEWVIHPPPVFGESLVYTTADFTVELRITGNSVPLVVAASSPAEQVENHYSFWMPAARTFAVSISPSYSLLEDESDGVKIRAYAFNGYEEQNQTVLKNAIEAVELFTELFGPLPHASVSIIQADFLDGMEFDGLYFVSKGFYDLYDGTVKGYLSLITVHEMAHQWWFGVVGSDQAMEPWLDESMATFAELQYIEYYYPDLTDWWWLYRVNIYEPEGQINLSIYEYPSYIAYRNAVYLRGAAYLYEFRSQLGVGEFNEGMRRYFEENYREIATQEDFFGAFDGIPTGLIAEVNAKYMVTKP